MTTDALSETGGCLCGAVRYEVSAEPYYVAVCSCTFCQRLTASDYNVEAMFREGQFRLTQGQTKTYTYVSDGSGQPVHIHFCETCGASLFLRPERFPDCVGVFAGSFDDPNWFRRDPDTVGYFFTSEAPRGMMIPAGFATYSGHAKTLDGSMNEATRLDGPIMVGRSDSYADRCAIRPGSRPIRVSSLHCSGLARPPSPAPQHPLLWYASVGATPYLPWRRSRRGAGVVASRFRALG